MYASCEIVLPKSGNALATTLSLTMAMSIGHHVPQT